MAFNLAAWAVGCLSIYCWAILYRAMKLGRNLPGHTRPLSYADDKWLYIATGSLFFITAMITGVIFATYAFVMLTGR